MEKSEKFKVSDPKINWLLETFVNPLVSGFIGYSFGGWKVAAGLSALTSIDQALINYDYANKHYITNSVIWSGLAIMSENIFTKWLPRNVPYVPNPKSVYLKPIFNIYNLVSVTAGVAYSYYAPNMINYENVLKEGVEAVIQINKLYDKNNIISYDNFAQIGKELVAEPYFGIKHIIDDGYKVVTNNLLIRNLICLTAFSSVSTYFFTQLTLKTAKYTSLLKNGYANLPECHKIDLENNNNNKWKEILYGSIKAIPIIIMIKLSHVVNDMILDYFSNNDNKIIHLHTNEKIFQNQNAIRLSNMENVNEILYGIDDLYMRLFSQAKTLTTLFPDIYSQTNAMKEVYLSFADIMGLS